MGLNYVPRGRRERLDPPNRFISGVLGSDDVSFGHEFLEDAVLDFEDGVLREVQERIRRMPLGTIRDPA